MSTDKILDQFKHADGLIIDLRNNGGGDMTYSFSQYGGHSTKVGKELPNGWFFSIAPQKIEFSDGHCYEGIGLSQVMRNFS